MKRLIVKSPAFIYIEKSFKEWLDVLGYAEQTVYSMPNYVRALLHFIEQKGKTEIKHITRDLIKEYYYSHLKNRPNLKKDPPSIISYQGISHIHAVWRKSNGVVTPNQRRRRRLQDLSGVASGRPGRRNRTTTMRVWD